MPPHDNCADDGSRYDHKAQPKSPFVLAVILFRECTRLCWNSCIVHCFLAWDGSEFRTSKRADLLHEWQQILAPKLRLFPAVKLTLCMCFPCSLFESFQCFG